jgi:hypothetical protein
VEVSLVVPCTDINALYQVEEVRELTVGISSLWKMHEKLIPFFLEAGGNIWDNISLSQL